jgi:hypothetical protein
MADQYGRTGPDTAVRVGAAVPDEFGHRTVDLDVSVRVVCDPDLNGDDPSRWWTD